MTRTPSAAVLARQATEDRFMAQMRRIAWTYQDPYRQSHAARNWRPLTEDQQRANGQAFEAAVLAFPDNRKVDPALAIVGDEAMVYSRGAVRAAVITKIGRTNFELMYVTPTALAQQASGRYRGVPVTKVSVRKTAVHAIRKGAI